MYGSCIHTYELFQVQPTETEIIYPIYGMIQRIKGI